MKVQRPVSGKFIWKIMCFLNGDISSYDKMIEDSGEAIFCVLKTRFFLLIFFSKGEMQLMQ